MAVSQIFARRNPTLTGEGLSIGAWGDRAGVLVTQSELDALVAAGFGFHVTVGALTTPIQGGGAGTVLDYEQSELFISVPTGTAIMPIRLSAQCEVPADQDGDVQEIFFMVDRATAHVVGTGTAETAFNMRTDNPRASVCTAVSANTGDHGTPTISAELARVGKVTNIVTAGISHGVLDLLYEPNDPPIIIGPATVLMYWCGTQAMSGFAQAQWIELPEELNALWGGS
jgi:hypothetical protein